MHLQMIGPGEVPAEILAAVPQAAVVAEAPAAEVGVAAAEGADRFPGAHPDVLYIRVASPVEREQCPADVTGSMALREVDFWPTTANVTGFTDGPGRRLHGVAGRPDSRGTKSRRIRP